MDIRKKTVLGCATVLLTSNLAFAESSITYHGGTPKSFDKKIAAAALKKAAAKIGDLRGSLDGLDEDHVATAKELRDIRRSSLGFPTIQENILVQPKEKGVPIV